jgi:hypothetical protein
LEHLTAGKDSSLLPTPAARDWKSSASNLIGVNARPLNEVLAALLPTPHANMTTGAGTSGRDGGLNLQTAITQLLPTPTVNDSRGGRNETAQRTNADSRHHAGRTLTDVMYLMCGGVDWGKYEPAIRHWENIHGAHPFPATIGPKGGVKPAPAFVEWMMALPAGHVSSVPHLTINEQLKLLGNGVVPAQAERALRCLTSDDPAFDSKENDMTSVDTSSFFTTKQTRDVPRDQYGRYKLPGPDGEDKSWTRATTFAATMAEQYGLSIWHQRQVAWGFGRRPDLVSMLSTIAGPEDKKALGEIVAEAHIAAGTQAKANRGTAIHTATAAAERSVFGQVPEEFRPHVANYLAELKRYRLQVLPEFIERTVIVPEYDVAGTFDNLVLCPDGKIRVLDKKTGREDYSDIEFAIQMSLYANATAMFNYDNGRYEPLPEIATDYAIIAHIDPESGRCELKRINIQWGWVWCRTSAEVRAIRKTKHVITPLIPPTEVADQLDATFGPIDATTGQIVANVTALPQFMPDYSQQVANDADTVNRMQSFGATQQDVDQFINARTTRALPTQAQAFPLNGGQDYATWAANQARVMGTVPGGYVDSTSPAPAAFQAFWSDDRHDLESEVDASVNGVPLAQYGVPAAVAAHGCSVGQPCPITGSDGLHTDGTVCLYGNARPGPVPTAEHTSQSPIEVTAQTEVVAEDVGSIGAVPVTNTVFGQPISDTDSVSRTQDGTFLVNGQPVMPPAEDIQPGDVDHPKSLDVAPDDAMVAKILKQHKQKAPIQGVARMLMENLGISESSPDGIRLNQYKEKLANQIVTLAHNRGVEVPGFGFPTGPGNPSGDKQRSPKPAAPDTSAEDKARETKVRVAVTSIRTATSLEQLQRLHAEYTETSIGWTDEMQNAARTRAAELDQESGEPTLSPLEMIQGATSRETMTKAWNIATANGTDMKGWTTELDRAAMAKQTELSALAAGSAQS